jgi:hypothetical protein
MKQTCHGINFKGGGTKRNELEHCGNSRSENIVRSEKISDMRVPREHTDNLINNLTIFE